VSTTDPRGERQWDQQLRVWGDGRFDRPWGTLKVATLVQSLDLRYRNPETSLDQTGRTLTTSAEATATSTAGSHWLVSGGFSVQHREAHHPQIADRADEQVSAAFLYGMGEYDRLLLYPMLRTDLYLTASEPESPTVAATPQLGVNVQPFERYNLRIKSSVGRSFRMPTLNDRYWVPGGNPGLQPERGWNLDTGLSMPWPRQHLELTAFLTWIDNQITWRPTEAGHWSPFNVKRMRSRGIEASYRLRRTLSPEVSIHGHLFYTLTDARDISDPSSSTYNQQVRYVPRHQIKTSVGLTWKNIHIGSSLRGVGRRYVTADNRQSLPPYLVVDGSVQTTFEYASVAARLGVSLDNIFDENYSILQYYPMPPRHGRIRLTVEWNTPQ
jgi:iron complex outermembrane receptor protein